MNFKKLLKNPILTMAIRNVGRNKRRSLITIFTVVLGTVVTIQTRGLINGLQAELIRNLTRKVNGDLQIHRAGYKDNLDANPFEYLIPYAPSDIQKLESQAGIEKSAPRLRVFGMINNQRTQKTTPVFISGIDSERELDVCPRMLSAVQEGEFIDSVKERAVTSGGAGKSALPSADGLEDAPDLDAAPRGSARKSSAAAPSKTLHSVLLTPSLARGLKAQLGDEMVILLKDANNMEQAVVARFTGTLDLNMPMAAAKMAWLDLSVLQKTLAIEGKTSEVAFRVREGTDLYASQKTLAASLGESIHVERWDEVAGFFSDVMGLQNAVFRVVLIIMFIIVTSAIVNTSMMTVSERVREIGTLMAIGYKRKHILSIFLIESTTIGVLGGIAGVAIGSLAVWILQIVGVEFNFPGTKTPFILRPYVTLSFVGMVFGLASLSALLAALYPSYRASRMKPVQALSSN